MNDNSSVSSVLRIKFLAFLNVVLPGERIALDGSALEAYTKSLLRDAKNNPKGLFGFLPKNPQTGYFIDMGTFFSVQQLEDEKAILLAGERFRVEDYGEVDEHGFFYDILVEPVKSQDKNLQEIFAKDRSLEKFFRQVLDNLKKNKKILVPTRELEKYTAGKLADYLASFLSSNNFFARSDVLETDSEEMRLDKVIMYLFANLESSPKKGSKSKNSSQPQQENKEVKEFQDKLNSIKEFISEEAKKEIQKEITSLAKTPPTSGNYDYIYKWLEFVLSFFSLKPTEDNQDTGSVWKILDESHYGLLKAKERVYEELIVRRLNPKKKGPILCFVGPPGTGKTSVGKAIAEALGRNFVRISLGGVRDEAEIRGHRRTYVGALPGKIAEYILRSKSSNPLLMIDEIDKVGKDTLKGNLEASLLEVFDPEQNHAFDDNYVKIPIDVSKVMIICTANTWEGILPALKDRMELLLFSGYTFEEKLNIAKKFLVKKQIKENGLLRKGLPIKKIKLSDKSISFVIGSYTSEAGVRNLEREMGCIFRKVATGVCLGNIKGEVNIGVTDIKKYLGLPKILPEKVRETPVGVVTGVAVTQNGGSLLEIEASVVNPEGTGKLELTGNLEKTIQESAKVALGYFRSNVKDGKKLKNDIHLHVPEGGVPKDGPSAGIAFASAYYSLFKKKKIKNGLVMTGEITLKGRVLRVGGIKEKVLAAERAGATEFILPFDNKNDFEELPLKTRKRMKFHLVENVDKVLDIAFERKK